jgi:hypothetical protein
MRAFAELLDRLSLTSSRNAKLVHFRRGKPPVVCNELMRVRHRLQLEQAKRKKQ